MVFPATGVFAALPVALFIAIFSQGALLMVAFLLFY